MARRPFVYCPYCATPLAAREFGHKVLPACEACGFVPFPDPKVAVTAFIALDEHLLLVRRGTNPGKGLWALPGGYMDAGELPIEALQREIREELDMAIAVGDLLSTHRIAGREDEPSPGFVLVYRAVPADPNCSPASPPNAYDDVAEARWYSARELRTAQLAPSAEFTNGAPEAAAIPLAFASTRDEVRHWLAQLEENSKES
jgi:ADP-ribose pyrophosphatase YjhB (NUDIX family)